MPIFHESGAVTVLLLTNQDLYMAREKCLVFLVTICHAEAKQ